jgi:hypothetical protein
MTRASVKVRQAGAVHVHHGPLAPGSVLVDGVGDEVLACARGSGDEHRGRVDALEATQGLEEPLHGARASEDLAVGGGVSTSEVAHLVLEAVGLDHLAHRQPHLAQVEGLAQVGARAQARGLQGQLHRAVGGDDDHRQIPLLRRQLLQHLHPAHAGHLQVEHQQVRRVRGDALEALHTVRCLDHRVALCLEVLPQRPADQLLVVTDEDGGGLGHGALQGGMDPGRLRTGSPGPVRYSTDHPKALFRHDLAQLPANLC